MYIHKNHLIKSPGLYTIYVKNRRKKKNSLISGAEHAWFRSYLTNTKQFVQCNRVNSNVDSCLNWEPHISQLIERVSPKIALLNRLAGFLDTKILLRIYKQQSSPCSDRLWIYRIA